MTDYEAIHRAITDETRAAIAAALGVDVANISRPRMSYGHRSVTLNETAIRALLALTATPTPEEN
jgi:hypothetical protein